MTTQAEPTTGHRWSGWPGAFCLNCGAEHALENAIGLNWYDPFTDEWDAVEHAQEVYDADAICPVNG